MSSGLKGPIQLLPIYRERIWGRESLAPYFSDTPRNQRIGEAWFTFEENATSAGRPLGELIREFPEILGAAAMPQYPGVCPLLVKFLFTNARMSVQVHPDDEYAERHHQSLGKTEAWYVMDAQLPGELAVGFRETLTPERLRSAAQSGEIDTLLEWRTVKPGELIFIPSGTVHAMGAGLTICEVQENSDLTYRLYDYGRARELHLEHAMRVSHLGRHECTTELKALGDGREELLACHYFRIERLRPKESIRIRGDLAQYLVLIAVKGPAAGTAWLIPARSEELKMDGARSEWILTYTAEKPVDGISV